MTELRRITRSKSGEIKTAVISELVRITQIITAVAFYHIKYGRKHSAQDKGLMTSLYLVLDNELFLDPNYAMSILIAHRIPHTVPKTD